MKSKSKLLTKILIDLILVFQFHNINAKVLPLSVNGSKVLIGGKSTSIVGNSFFWSNTGWGGEKYYNKQSVEFLKKNWGSKIVRAAMGVEEQGGYLSDITNKKRVETVVDAAIANSMYVVIDWHSHHAEQFKEQAINFFKEMATKYGKNNSVIYEVYNEPLDISWSNVIKPYAQEVIAAIRQIDPDNLIVIGTPRWSQEVDIAANDPITGFKNIAYSLHFYAGTHGKYLRDKAQEAIKKGLPLFITEWGTVDANGNGNVAASETNAWVDFMKANNLSNVNWAINDKEEGASALIPGASSIGGWQSNELTASGKVVKTIVKNWSVK